MKKLYAIITFCLFCGYTVFSQTISSNAPLCGNANLTLELTATGGNTYAWTGPNGFTSTLQKPTIKNVNWKNRGVYTVIIDGKTTLNVDVYIKDPVVFTVPKEILVCEGGDFIIKPESGNFTDSTEAIHYYEVVNSFDEKLQDGILKNISPTNIGRYKVKGYSIYINRPFENLDGCPTTQSITVKINTANNCKSIQIEDLSKVKMCYGQSVSIPFTTKGDFKTGTKFNVYVTQLNSTSNSFKNPIATVEKSPIVIENMNQYFDKTFAIVIIADNAEKTTTISNYKYFYDHRFSINSAQSCDSSNLSVNYNFNINNLQWFFNGNPISKATQNRLTAKTTGTYFIRYTGNVAKDEIDKTCIYQSDPVKIELGKIPQPVVKINSNIELCVGRPATLNISPNPNTTYRWKKDGVFIINANKPTFETLQEGQYQIEAKQGACTSISDTVVLKKPERLPSFDVQPTNCIRSEEIKNTYQLCNNQSFDFKIDQTLTQTRLLLIRDGVVIKDTNSNEIKGLKGSGNYFIKMDYGNCTRTSNYITIKYDTSIYMRNYLDVDNKKNWSLCDGERVVLNLYGSILNGSIFRDVKQFNYSLGNGKIYRDSEVIQSWNKIGSNYYDESFTPKQSGMYYATGSILFNDGSICKVYTDTLKVIFAKKVDVIAYNYDKNLKLVPLTSCKDTAIINTFQDNYWKFDGRAVSFKWTKDGAILSPNNSEALQTTQPGIYQLETVYKGYNCPVVSSKYRLEFGKIKVGFYAFGDPTSICNGETYELHPYFLQYLVDIYSAKNVYSLYKDDQILTPNIKLNNGGKHYGEYLPLTQSGTYKLKVSDGKCEGTSPDFVLKVDKIPTTITPTDSVIFCAGKTVDLKASTEAGLSYIWERNGSVINQANQATLTASTDGLYKATLLRGGCWGTTPSVKLKSLANITPTATLTGDQKIGLDQETKLSVNLTSHAPWTFKLSDGKEYTATKSPFDITVKPLTTTTYSLTEVSNICGTGTVSGTAKIEIIILSTEEEKELSVEVFPMPSSEICNWKIETPEATTASVELIDVLGYNQFSELSNTRSQTHQGSINLSNLKAGTYFLKLQAGEKSVTRKVVKF